MSLKQNVVANYIAQGWVVLMGIAFVPLYIRYLGMESYGLIGFFSILLAWLSLVNMGMTPTLNREMARFTAGVHTPESIRDLLRSLELPALGLTAVIAVCLWMMAPWLSTAWLQAKELPVDALVASVSTMGVVAALRFLEGIYQGAIVGLQKQVWLSVARASFATMRSLGAIGVLVWVSATIEAYFLWQGVVSLLTVAIYARFVYRNLPASRRRARFSWKALEKVWSFAGGMLLTTVLALLLTQMDKILLSRLLSLEAFGYYALGWAVAGALYNLIEPVTQAFYPRLTELVARGDKVALVESYHRAAQVITVVAGPVALVLALFPKEILFLWTNDSELAANVAPLLALLALGTFLNGILHIPHALQLAHGWVALGVRVNLVAVGLLIPIILWVAPRYGALGAAWVWFVLNGANVLTSIHFMHRRLLPDQKWRWYGPDILFPLIAIGIVLQVVHIIKPEAGPPMYQISWLVLAVFLSFSAAILASSMRVAVLDSVKRIVKHICTPRS